MLRGDARPCCAGKGLIIRTASCGAVRASSPPPNYSTPNPRAPPSGVSPRGSATVAAAANCTTRSTRRAVCPRTSAAAGTSIPWAAAVREQLSARPQNPSPISNPFFGRARAAAAERLAGLPRW